MNRLAVYFNNPKQVEVRDETIPTLLPGQVLVKTLLSAISPGTEMLVYRHQVPADLPRDEHITALTGNFDFPLKFGYAAVGKVIETEKTVEEYWRGKLVFAFHPHESYFTAFPKELLPLPDNIPPEEAVFLPNMESAVNFVMDGQPIIGEQVTVFGQGIVGLLTTTMLAQFPLETLVTVDPIELRRQTAIASGAQYSIEPADLEKMKILLHKRGADLTFELSGNPDALNQAIAVTGFNGRIILGSWYGTKPASIDLGGQFHRSRIRMVSSQVSTISPQLSGRWDKERRFEVVWRMLQKVRPSRFISHRFDISHAAEAYKLLDEKPSEVIQVVFTY